VEGRIQELERRLAAIERELARPETYADGTRIPELVAEFEAGQAELSALTARWEELASAG
jgi:hypothetical protein